VTTKAARQLAPVRIFLVDDSELILRLVPLCLSMERVKIIGMARSAEEALPEIEAMRPDLVIADVCLPEMDGVTMATELRRVNPQARIILISVDKLRTPLPPRHQCADAFVAKLDLADELAPTVRLLFPKVLARRH
jgi:DNA-binding NarL/FixJ family response regulator